MYVLYKDRYGWLGSTTEKKIHENGHCWLKQKCRIASTVDRGSGGNRNQAWVL